MDMKAEVQANKAEADGRGAVCLSPTRTLSL